MTIFALAQLLDTTIAIRWSVHRDPHWFAFLDSVEVKSGCTLESTAGEGTSPAEALADYCRKLSGKIVVVRAMSDDRRSTLTLPQITVEASE